MPGWNETAEAKALQRYCVLVAGVAALIGWTIAGYGVANTPWVADLEGVLNPGTPHREESTFTYLFIGPVFITVAFLSGWGAPDYILSQMPKTKAGFVWGTIVGIAFVLFFLSLTIYRVRTALALVQ
jgi:hypothetical protein